jgi:2-methylcitrate dehydratase
VTLVDVHPRRSTDALPRTEQLAWHLAQLAATSPAPDADVAEMVVNRLIDDAAVAAAALTRAPVAAARDQALRYRAAPGATVLGLDLSTRVSPEWAAWANGVAVRELDFHDTYLGADYAHPGDNIPALVAVAQHARRLEVTGADLVRAIAVAYEVQIALTRSVCLHEHRIDHVAHLGVSVATGLGALLRAESEVTFQAIGQALHVTTQTRQSRKGAISTWKAYAPAFAAKAAIEAVDRAWRGQTSPEPIYEGEDGVMAWLLGGPDAHYGVALPDPGQSPRSILESFTKEHSAEYQAQAWIDLARGLRLEHPELADADLVEEIVLHTSHHTHQVIGSGSGDPEKCDATASRETLDHSLPYILAVALQDGEWHHERSYAPSRAQRPDTLALWRKVTTVEDPEWTRRYHASGPEKAFGGRLRARLADGREVVAEIALPDAHPGGARPFARAQYVKKFRSLSAGVVEPAEADRFLEAAQSVADLPAGALGALSFHAASGVVEAVPATEGIL